MTNDAHSIHHKSFVHDYAPLGGPFVMTERLTAAMTGAIGAGLSVGPAIRAMILDRLDELREDPTAREAVGQAWRSSGVDAVTVTLGGLELAPSDWDAVLREAAYWHERARAGGDFAVCTSSGELRQAFKENRIGIILAIQDAGVIGDDLARLTTLRHLGLRVAQLTFNRRNLIGDGCTERDPAGLSHFGVAAVAQMNKLGIIVDVSHSGNRTTLDAINVSERPVAITHSSCAAIHNHPRAKTDEVLEHLAQTDGYIGIVALPSFLGSGEADLDLLLRHIHHAANIVGIERVGLGTDWGPWCPDFPELLKKKAHSALAGYGFSPTELPDFGAAIPGLDRWESWPAITQALVESGLSEEEVRGVIGENWLRFMGRVGV